MRLLATGLSGFVGSHCAQQFAAVDLLVDGRLADLRNRDEVMAAVAQAQPEAVLHLAAQSNVPESFQNPQLTREVNVGGTLNLLHGLDAIGFRGRMLYVGSAEAYGLVGEAQLPVTEAYPLKPLNPYAHSKAEAEALCREWSQKGQFEIVIARPFNHIGPRQSTRFAVASFARQIAAFRAGRGAAHLEAGDLDTTRDFTDVRDVVRAYAMLLRSGRNGQAYNVCSGVERSLRDVVRAMMEVAGVEMEIKTQPGLLRKSEQRRMLGSFDKIHADTGWTPTVGLRQTLVDTLQFWEEEDRR